MRAMQSRTEAEGLKLHESLDPRIYTGNDNGHGARIVRSLAMARKALKDASGKTKDVLEIGCGTCDIVGPLTLEGWHGNGQECNIKSIKEAVERFPAMRVVHTAIFSYPRPTKANLYALVIMCEVLEHLAEPMEVAESWLRKSETSVISHPLDEALDSTMSAGEHCWSLSMMDHEAFFKAGGHKIVETELFDVSGYAFVISRGVRL